MICQMWGDICKLESKSGFWCLVTFCQICESKSLESRILESKLLDSDFLSTSQTACIFWRAWRLFLTLDRKICNKSRLCYNVTLLCQKARIQALLDSDKVAIYAQHKPKAKFREVSEWLKEHAWNACKVQAFEGSNPFLSAIVFTFKPYKIIMQNFHHKNTKLQQNHTIIYNY